MTIADLLAAEFLAAGGDIERGRDRAADAATYYIVRRLRQLERRFPRHLFTFSHRRHLARLLVYPQVGRVNDIQSLLNMLCSRSTRWRTMAGLRRLEIELRSVSFRTEHEFDRLLGHINSSAAPTRRGAVSAGTEAAQAYDRSVIACCHEDERRFNRRPSPSTETIFRSALLSDLRDVQRSRRQRTT